MSITLKDMQVADILGYSQRLNCTASRPRQHHPANDNFSGAGVSADAMATELNSRNISSPSAPLPPSARCFLQPCATVKVLSKLAAVVEPSRREASTEHSLGEMYDPGPQEANQTYSAFEQLLGFKVRSFTTLPVRAFAHSMKNITAILCLLICRKKQCSMNTDDGTAMTCSSN